MENEPIPNYKNLTRDCLYTLEMLFCIQVIECFSTIKEACKIVVKIRYSPYMYNNIPLGCDWNGLVVRILELI